MDSDLESQDSQEATQVWPSLANHILSLILAGNTIVAEEQEEADDSDFDNEYWPDLRRQPFDLYKALHITPNSNGGFSGGHTRARACYHKQVLRHGPPDDWLWNLSEPTLSCATCRKRLELGRNWYHRHSEQPLAEEGDKASTDDVSNYSKFPRNSSGVDICVKHIRRLPPDVQLKYTKESLITGCALMILLDYTVHRKPGLYA
eukprot:2569013-Pyramimonas_sp.AAC.1